MVICLELGADLHMAQLVPFWFWLTRVVPEKGPLNVCMHQGSALSPLLFVIVMEAISREFRVALPWELLYADDLAVIAETEEDLIKRLNEWKDNVESKNESQYE